MEEAKKQFLINEPHYGYSNSSLPIDQLRNKHFSRLDSSQPIIYLDHAGTTLPSEIQLQESFRFLSTSILGNPHSANPSSQESTKQIEAARVRVLQWFGVDPSEYSLIFTAGSTASLKLVGESFPFSVKSILRMTQSNHTSAVGIREYALNKQARVEIVDDNDLSILGTIIPDSSDNINQESNDKGFHLFIYPAESNYSGKKFPLDWSEKYQRINQNSNSNGFQWKTLLDASSFISCNQLDLSKYPFDFVTFSFHKLFGYPSGLGGLLIRKGSEICLQKPYFGGGTVTGVLATERYAQFRNEPHAKLEDGTVSFSAIASLQFGFQILESLNINQISLHTHCLTQYLYRELSALKHSNGKPVCKIFGEHHTGDLTKQGAILCLVFLRSNEELVGYAEVEKLASISGIHLRSGCFCNVGECHSALELTNTDVKSHLELGHVCWDDRDIINGKSTGATRISLGYMTTFEDCWRFLAFVKKYFVESDPELIHYSKSESFVKIEDIILYPIKSCGGFSVEKWRCTAKGLLYDREWVLVDLEGRMLTSKNTPILVTIRPELNFEKDSLIVRCRNLPELNIPLSLDSNSEMNSMSVRVCGDDCQGFSYGSEVDTWFSNAIQIPCKLVRQAQDFVRTCKLPTSAEDRVEQVSFANESQLLVLNQESVLSLREKISENAESSHFQESLQTTIARFRANLVVSGAAPYSEDLWAYLENANVTIRGLSVCARCRMICTHPDSGEIELSGEPLATLSTYRREKGRVIFGKHFSCSASLNAELNLGDILHIRWA